MSSPRPPRHASASGPHMKLRWRLLRRRKLKTVFMIAVLVGVVLFVFKTWETRSWGEALVREPPRINRREIPLSELVRRKQIPMVDLAPTKAFYTTANPIYAFSTTPNLKQLCVLIRTYKQQYRNLPTLLLNFGQDQIPIHVFVTVTEPSSPIEPLHVVADKLNSFVGRKFIHILDISEQQARSVWVQPDGTPDYGYTYTDFALDMMVAGNAQCDYLLVTNGDNIYAPNFGYRYLLSHMRSNLELIGIKFVDHGPLPGSLDTYADKGGGKIVDDATLKPHIFKWKVDYCDLGSVIFKWTWFKDMDVRFVKDTRRHKDGRKDLLRSDGHIIGMVAKLAGKKKKLVTQLIFMHQ